MNDVSMCCNKNCPIAACARGRTEGPQSDMQWMAAYSPQTSENGQTCDGFVAVKPPVEKDKE